MNVQDFLKTILESIVTEPTEVSVERQDDDLGVLLSVRVSKADMPSVIGKDGRTINAIRTVVRVFGAKNDERVNIKVIED